MVISKGGLVGKLVSYQVHQTTEYRLVDTQRVPGGSSEGHQNCGRRKNLIPGGIILLGWGDYFVIS